MREHTPHDVQGCLACDLAQGRLDLPGGRIYASDLWVVEHCIGPFGVGALIVKPLRHCLHISELTREEASELGPLLKRATATIEALIEPDQVYVCLWSHMGWTPGHIHFVLQPSWNSFGETHKKPGPSLQVDMLEAGELPARDEVETFAARARELYAGATAHVASN